MQLTGFQETSDLTDLCDFFKSFKPLEERSDLFTGQTTNRAIAELVP